MFERVSRSKVRSVRNNYSAIQTTARFAIRVTLVRKCYRPWIYLCTVLNASLRWKIPRIESVIWNLHAVVVEHVGVARVQRWCFGCVKIRVIPFFWGERSSWKPYRYELIRPLFLIQHISLRVIRSLGSDLAPNIYAGHRIVQCVSIVAGPQSA